MPSIFTSGLRLEKIAPGEQNNTWGDTGNANLDRIDAGIGWRTVATQDFASAQNVVTFAVPPYARRIRIEFQKCLGVIQTSIYLRASYDGGVTYAAGAADYIFAIQGFTSGNVQQLYGGTSSALIMTQNTMATNAMPVFGDIDIDVGAQSCAWRVQGGLADGSVLMTTGGGIIAHAGVATHILMGFAGTTMSSGQFKLLASA